MSVADHHLAPYQFWGLQFQHSYGKIKNVLRRYSVLQDFLEGIFMLSALKSRGQGLVEYAIILALVAIVVVAVMRLLGPQIGNTFSSLNSSIPG
jgi:pilus assembly protein Flp/PilA